MRSAAERKEEWLRYSGLGGSADDRWLRDVIATLFELPYPNDEQQLLMTLADAWLIMFDLPVAGNPTHKAKMFSKAEEQFGPTPSHKK